MTKLELQPSDSKAPCSSLPWGLPPWVTLACILSLLSFSVGVHVCFLGGGNWDSERSWNRQVPTQLGAELRPHLLSTPIWLGTQNLDGIPCWQNLPTGMPRVMEETAVYPRVPWRSYILPLLLSAGNPCQPGKRPRDWRVGCVAAPNKPPRADFPEAETASRGCEYIFLTIKQTSRLAEHCRENDITAEF